MTSSNSRKTAESSNKRPANGKPARKKRRQRRRRLTDKIRAALARAAALGRRDVTEQLGTLYQERVQEELGRGGHRRSRDPAAALPTPRRSR
jgi:hypothetical protein